MLIAVEQACAVGVIIKVPSLAETVDEVLVAMNIRLALLG